MFYSVETANISILSHIKCQVNLYLLWIVFHIKLQNWVCWRKENIWNCCS